MSTASVERIALYYRFAPIPDPEAVRLWQLALCRQVGVRGRIIVSPQGINGTVGGPVQAVKAYVKATREYGPFHDLEIKYSDGGLEDFPRLSVKVKPELVAFGAAERIQVTADGVVGTGTHLRPDQVDALVAERADSERPVVFLDGRNTVEAEIGRFASAFSPGLDGASERIETTRDFLTAIDTGAFDHLRHTPVVTYCTGGVRCEILSALLIQRGFEEVYQLDGGIVRYGESRGDAGLWQGELAVFDRRMALRFSDDAETIGRCVTCQAATSQLRNCADSACTTLSVRCADCATTAADWTCSVCAQAGTA
ncbi:MAG: rhodanese-related sulfurtransferase [Micrococcus sp.]|nr:rhodanese-related sulfurtransferase [Micrococcus sp.]